MIALEYSLRHLREGGGDCVGRSIARWSSFMHVSVYLEAEPPCQFPVFQTTHFGALALVRLLFHEDPPSISGPAASAWRPMTAACRAHDRAALAARWPWPPPRGAAHHNHKPPQTPAAHHARHTPHHLLPLPLKSFQKVFMYTPLNATYP